MKPIHIRALIHYPSARLSVSLVSSSSESIRSIVQSALCLLSVNHAVGQHEWIVRFEGQVLRPESTLGEEVPAIHRRDDVVLELFLPSAGEVPGAISVEESDLGQGRMNSAATVESDRESRRLLNDRGDPVSPGDDSVLEEFRPLYERGDLQFIERLRHCTNASALAGFAATWFDDHRPEARQLLVSYLRGPLQTPGHRPLLKRLFKLAERADDAEIMGLFLVSLDRAICRKRPGEDVFSMHTRSYLRRRTWRYFRRLGKADPRRYVTTVRRALVCYREVDVEGREKFLRNWGLLHILFHRSPDLKANASRWVWTAATEWHAPRPAPAFREAWKADGRPLLELVRDAPSRLVADWAIRMTRQHHGALLREVATATLLGWLGHPAHEVMKCAIDLLKERDLSSLTVSYWTDLLSRVTDLVSLEKLGTFLREWLSPERVGWQEAFWFLRDARPPVAQLGFWLVRGHWAVGVLDLRDLLALTDSVSAEIRRTWLRWLEHIWKGAAGLEPRMFLRLFESPHSEVRKAVCQWFGQELARRADGSVWEQLMQSPQDDVRGWVADLLSRQEHASRRKYLSINQFAASFLRDNAGLARRTSTLLRKMPWDNASWGVWRNALGKATGEAAEVLVRLVQVKFPHQRLRLADLLEAIRTEPHDTGRRQTGLCARVVCHWLQGRLLKDQEAPSLIREVLETATARSGPEWLQGIRLGSEKECEVLLSALPALTGPVRCDVVRWMRQTLQASPWFRLDWLLQFLESDQAEARAEGTDWLHQEPRCRAPKAWERLLEVRHADVRVRVGRLLVRPELSEVRSGLSPDRFIPWLRSSPAEVVEAVCEVLQALDWTGARRGAWLDFLEIASLEVLAVVCPLLEERLSAEGLTMEAAVRLACHPSLPAARLGMRWLQKMPLVTAEDHELLLGLVEARAEAVRRELVLWTRARLSALEGFQVEWVRGFLDSRYEDVRATGWSWLEEEPRAANNVGLWQQLMESPYDDVRLRLIGHLEKVFGEKESRPRGAALDSNLLQWLWASVLLNIHRGGRSKPLAIRELLWRLEERREEAPLLMPLLAAMLRSLRSTEWQGALAAIVQLIERNPALERLAREHFPDLKFLPVGP